MWDPAGRSERKRRSEKRKIQGEKGREKEKERNGERFIVFRQCVCGNLHGLHASPSLTGDAFHSIQRLCSPLVFWTYADFTGFQRGDGFAHPEHDSENHVLIQSTLMVPPCHPLASRYGRKRAFVIYSLRIGICSRCFGSVVRSVSVRICRRLHPLTSTSFLVTLSTRMLHLSSTEIERTLWPTLCPDPRYPDPEPIVMFFSFQNDQCIRLVAMSTNGVT